MLTFDSNLKTNWLSLAPDLFSHAFLLFSASVEIKYLMSVHTCLSNFPPIHIAEANRCFSGLMIVMVASHPVGMHFMSHLFTLNIFKISFEGFDNMILLNPWWHYATYLFMGISVAFRFWQLWKTYCELLQLTKILLHMFAFLCVYKYQGKKLLDHAVDISKHRYKFAQKCFQVYFIISIFKKGTFKLRIIIKFWYLNTIYLMCNQFWVGYSKKYPTVIFT